MQNSKFTIFKMVKKAFPSPPSRRNVVALLKSPIEEQNKPSLVRGEGRGRAKIVLLSKILHTLLKFKKVKIIKKYRGSTE